MRNMRSAFWALGLAGAAYAWKNRDRLRQQFGGAGQRGSQGLLPDYNSGNGQPDVRGPDERNSGWEQSNRQPISGSEV